MFLRLKLSGSLESDDAIYNTFREKFPKLDVSKMKELDLKSETAKVEWRQFSEGVYLVVVEGSQIIQTAKCFHLFPGVYIVVANFISPPLLQS